MTSMWEIKILLHDHRLNWHDESFWINKKKLFVISSFNLQLIDLIQVESSIIYDIAFVFSLKCTEHGIFNFFFSVNFFFFNYILVLLLTILETNLLKMLQNLWLKFGCRHIFLTLFYICVSKLLLVIIISYETNLWMKYILTTFLC